mmetsp:Transcript_16922/g.39412  ORF Transcript_16922/g.39412 Transcript_16922/m.39412 type:complete len:246 (+) Transcript_16922:1562-2299(+)
MNHPPGVQVAHSRHHLPEEKLGSRFLQPATTFRTSLLYNVLVQLTATAELQDDVEHRSLLKAFVHLDDVWVLKVAENRPFHLKARTPASQFSRCFAFSILGVILLLMQHEGLDRHMTWCSCLRLISTIRSRQCQGSPIRANRPNQCLVNVPIGAFTYLVLYLVVLHELVGKVRGEQSMMGEGQVPARLAGIVDLRMCLVPLWNFIGHTAAQLEVTLIMPASLDGKVRVTQWGLAHGTNHMRAAHP